MGSEGNSMLRNFFCGLLNDIVNRLLERMAYINMSNSCRKKLPDVATENIFLCCNSHFHVPQPRGLVVQALRVHQTGRMVPHAVFSRRINPNLLERTSALGTLDMAPNNWILIILNLRVA